MIDTGFRYLAIDSFVSELYPSTNYGRQGNLSIGDPVGGERRIYIKPIRPGGAANVENKLINATLKLRQRGAWAAGTHTVTVRLLAEKFYESDSTGSSNGVRWSNKPDGRATGSGTTLAALSFSVTGGQPDKTEHEFELATIFNNAITNGWVYHGIAVTVDTADVKSYYSTEYSVSTLRPMFRWVWALRPLKPTALHPAAARSAVDPLFQANFNFQAASWQLQVDTTDDFASPINDITETGVGQSKLYYDASEDGAWVSLTNNVAYYWRCRFTSSAGLTSPWAAATAFSIKAAPVVAITSPATATETDPAPTISYDFTPGAAHASGQKENFVSVRRWGDGRWIQPVYDQKTGKWNNGWQRNWTAGTGGTFQVPTGELRTNEKYLVIVRARDTQTRDDCATDRDYAQDTAIFTLDTDEATAGVATLTVTQKVTNKKTGNPPINILRWTRGSTPDRFRISRRPTGESKWTRISEGPASDYGSASPWKFIDFYGHSGVEVVYKVDCVAADKVSKSVNQNYFFQQETDNWSLDTDNGAAATIDVFNESGTPSGVCLRCEITNDGSQASDIEIYQALTTASPGQTFKVVIRARSPEADRNITYVIRRDDSPFTAYDTVVLALTDEWQRFENDSVVSAGVPIRISVYVGNDPNTVEFSQIFVELQPLARATIETYGWWIVSDDGVKQIPMVMKLDQSDIEWDEPGKEVYHPIGGMNVVIRSPQLAKRGVLQAILDLEDGDYLAQLQSLCETSQLCYAISHNGRSIPCVLTNVSESAAPGPRNKRYIVTVGFAEVAVD